MLKRGARRFAFLGRSALDSTPARKLVEELRGHGASVDVFRGDAGVYEDMQRAISQVKTPIGGVVHAAMGLHVSFFISFSRIPSSILFMSLTASRKPSSQP